jgi:two-component system, response regulator, stage 0 sporulation protein F
MPRPVSGARRRVRHILLVDDYDDARMAVSEALAEAGHVVVEATDGQEALNVLVAPDQDVGLIIVDLQMPVMDGWRFIELLNCYVKLSTIPVIVVTAALQPYFERIRHPAVYACIQAPYSLATLLEMVDDCLSVTRRQGSVDTA